MNKITEFFETTDKKNLIISGISIALILVLTITTVFALPPIIRKNKKTKEVQAPVKTTSTTKLTTTTELDVFEVETIEATTEETTVTTTTTTKVTTTKAPTVLKKDEYEVKPADPKEDGKTDSSKGDEANVDKPAPPPQEVLPTPPPEETTGGNNETEPSNPNPPSGKVEIPKGSLVGWNNINGNYYYFDNNHNYLTGLQSIGGLFYKFNSYGANASKLAIDVSSHNGAINWAQVKAAGVDYAIIRVGYRGYRNGSLMADTKFKDNINGALANGIQVGVYFYSQAINEAEAIEEASLAINSIKGYNVKLPIYFDTEFTEMNGSSNPGRGDKLTTAQRTSIARTFCDTVRGAGYKAGVYASKSFYYSNLNFNELSSYYIWLAHYTSNVTDFKYNYSMWQYTEKGKLSGISGYVDVNVCMYDFVNNNDMSQLGENIVFI